MDEGFLSAKSALREKKNVNKSQQVEDEWAEIIHLKQAQYQKDINQEKSRLLEMKQAFKKTLD